MVHAHAPYRVLFSTSTSLPIRWLCIICRCLIDASVTPVLSNLSPPVRPFEWAPISAIDRRLCTEQKPSASGHVASVPLLLSSAVVYGAGFGFDGCLSYAGGTGAYPVIATTTSPRRFAPSRFSTAYVSAPPFVRSFTSLATAQFDRDSSLIFSHHSCSS